MTAGLRPQRPGLTVRERQVLHGIVAGRTNREIATELVIAEETVRTYVARILATLQVHTRTAAAVLAIRTGLVEKGPQ